VTASASHFEDHWKIPHPIDDVGKTKGWPPYKLRWTIKTIRMEKPNLIEFKASGDFSTDSSKWILRPQGKETLVTLDWNPKAGKPIVKLLSPVLKPVFEWNHHWAMNRGEKQLNGISRKPENKNAG
jgi:hypothetical protein